MPDAKRKKRIEESIRRELGRLLLSYPRQLLFNKIIITDVDVAPDLSVAKVFFSTFDEIDITEAKNQLEKEIKFLRMSLARNLNLRLTPRLNFVHDTSIQKARHISILIDQAIADDESHHN